MSSSSPSSKPWCKVCKDSGEPESVYTTHFVKDNKGKSICPKLLALNCRTCGESGHTVKFCKTTKLREAAEKKALTMKVILAIPKKKDVLINMYDTLFLGDEEEEEELEEFPSLTGKEEVLLSCCFPDKKKINKKLLPLSYAAVTSKTEADHQQQKPQQVIVAKTLPCFKQGELKEKKKFSWADVSSSSEGEDEEEEESAF